jgi:hypothetical protein
VLEGSTFDLHRAFLDQDAADLPTLGTGLLATELLSLLAGGRLHGSGSQPPSGSHRHGLHLCQIDVEPWALLAEGLPSDDFSPTVSQPLDAGQVFRSELP